MVIWIYGLSGSGKTTLANALYSALRPSFPRLILLDGEDLRAVVPHIGYDELDRTEMGEIKCRLAALLARQECSVILTGISWRPTDAKMVPDYFSIFLDVPVSECARRKPTGLYAGTDRNIVGIDLEYRRPVNPNVTITVADQAKGIRHCVDMVLAWSCVSGSRDA